MLFSCEGRGGRADRQEGLLESTRWSLWRFFRLDLVLKFIQARAHEPHRQQHLLETRRASPSLIPVIIINIQAEVAILIGVSVGCSSRPPGISSYFRYLSVLIGCGEKCQVTDFFLLFTINNNNTHIQLRDSNAPARYMQRDRTLQPSPTIAN